MILLVFFSVKEKKKKMKTLNNLKIYLSKTRMKSSKYCEGKKKDLLMF